MNKFKKEKILEEDLGINPFQNGLEIRVRDITFDKQYKKNGEDWMPVVQEVEYEPFCKLYFFSERRLITNKLSLRAVQMLLWIQYEIDHGKDFLWMNKKRYMEELEIKSVNTYKDAIKELIRYGFITPTLATDYYWINPDFIFKGDRIKKYPKNVVKI